MRKWQDLATYNDEGSWYDVDGMWPTVRGSYENIDFLSSGTEVTATGSGAVSYAWCANALSAQREYVVDTGKIWQYSGGAFTDRTGGVTIGSYPMMAQYGDVTICVMGNAITTVYSTGGNFAALAGAPKGEIVAVASNAVLIFNTDTDKDGWHASDVGDYTNWSSGESASGRIITTPGPITAAVTFGNDVIVFKPNAMYRMRYVGGIVKWAIELISVGVGVQEPAVYQPQEAKYYACAGNSGVLFCGFYRSALSTAYVYFYDGASLPRRVNYLTSVVPGRVAYDASRDTFLIKSVDLVNSIPNPDVTNFTSYFYNVPADAWGKVAESISQNGGVTRQPLMGEFSATAERSSYRVMYGKQTSDFIKRWTPSSSNSGACYAQTTIFGAPDRKTKFLRVTAITPELASAIVCTMTANYYTELISGWTGGTSASVTESSQRKRFDVTTSAGFARFKMNYDASGVGVEIDDVLVEAEPAGKN